MIVGMAWPVGIFRNSSASVGILGDLSECLWQSESVALCTSRLEVFWLIFAYSYQMHIFIFLEFPTKIKEMFKY